MYPVVYPISVDVPPASRNVIILPKPPEYVLYGEVENKMALKTIQITRQPTPQATPQVTPHMLAAPDLTMMDEIWQGEFLQVFAPLRPHAWYLTATDHCPSPRWRRFKDSAKVRFCCQTCGHAWTSMKGRVVFWYFFNVPYSEGFIQFKLYGQQCQKCNHGLFESAMWYPEEVNKVLCNVYNKIGQTYYGFVKPPIRYDRRAGKPRTQHNALLCQACRDGECDSRPKQQANTAHNAYVQDPPPYLKEAMPHTKEPILYAKEPLSYAKDQISYAKEPVHYVKEPMHYVKEPVHYAKEPVNYAKDSMTYTKDPGSYGKGPLTYHTRHVVMTNTSIQRNVGTHSLPPVY